MIVNKYKRTSEDNMIASADAIARNKKRDEGHTYLYERPLPPDSLLRVTEDFSPVYEMAFRAGVTGEQGRATLRTIERIHREKMKEMATWTEAMRRAEAEKHRALKRIEDDMEVEQLRAQLKVMKSRLDDKNKDLSDNNHFLQQVAALRSSYDKDRGKQYDMMESPSRASRSNGVREEDGMFSSARQSTGKKQKLYNALHYSSIYDDDDGQRCEVHGERQCPYCGESTSSPSSLAASPAHVQVSGLSSPTPLKVHEKYFHQRPPATINFSPAKAQLNPLKTGPQGQPPLDVATLLEKDSGEGGRSARSLAATPSPFGMSRKQATGR